MLNYDELKCLEHARFKWVRYRRVIIGFWRTDALGLCSYVPLPARGK